MNQSAYLKLILMKIMRFLFIAFNVVLVNLYLYKMELPVQTFLGNYMIYFAITVLYGSALFYLLHIYNGFGVGSFTVWELAYSIGLATVISGGIMYIVLTGYMHHYLGLLPFFALLFIQLAWGVVWTVLADRIYFYIHLAKETAIVYRSEADLQKLERSKNFWKKFKIKKQIKNPTNIHDIIPKLRGCKVVFVLGINATLRNGILKYCVEENVQAYIEPKVGDIIMSGASHAQMFSVPIFRVRRAAPDPIYLLLKRLFDIMISLAAIVVFSPFMLVTALAIKLQDGGPVFYKQVRLTKNGKKFYILKFRSMRVDAEKDGVARLASEKDDRITPVGRVIRAIRFDELPQLFNILWGSMSIVGPRPERPEIAEQYGKSIPAFALRLQVKAGLTGYAQVYGKYNTQPYDKLQMDLMYINNMSLRQDLWLMFATVKILFMKESTDGIKQGQVTAELAAGKEKVVMVNSLERNKERG